MKSAYKYFAYGSDINIVQMKQRCPGSKVLGIARLQGYKVEFYGYSSKWDGAQEAVIRSPQSEVLGVLYEMQTSDWEFLDGYHDARSNGTGEYFHCPVEVIDIEQKKIEALIYKKDILNEVKFPSTEYLNFIVQGAKEQGLPIEYIKLLQNKETKPASYAVPKEEPSKFSFLSVTRSSCDHEN